MIKATCKDKKKIVDILTKSFDGNQSVNYILRKDKKRIQSVRALMDYSFENCCLFGEIFISEDRHACALLIYPDKKRTTFKSMMLDIQLIVRCIGFRNIRRTMHRESLIKKIQPHKSMSYLWFIGVDPEHQAKGAGSRLLVEILEDSRNKHRPVYLETSTIINLPWYKKFGFEVYHEEDLGYKLYFLKNEFG